MEETKTKTVEFTAYPYASQSAKIEVPENLTTEEEIKGYISEHWNDVKFGELELDYAGTDVELWD